MDIMALVIYFILFLIAVIPPKLGWKPFTYHLSHDRYTKVKKSSKKFLDVNNNISYMWGFVFLICFLVILIGGFLGMSHLSINVIAMVIQLAIATPLTFYIRRKELKH